MTTPTPDDGRLWAVTVTIPAHIDEGDRDDLFDLVADTAHRWEPDDRDGWDIDVSAGPVESVCPHVVTEGTTSHCTLADLLRALAEPAGHDHRNLTPTQTALENTARLAATGLVLAAHTAGQLADRAADTARTIHLIAHLLRNR